MTGSIDWKKVGNYAARYGTFTGLVIIFIAFALFIPRFATLSNLTTLLVQVSMLAIVASGLTTVFSVAEIDISTGANVSLAGVLAAWLFTQGASTLAAILLALVVGILFGTANGIFVGILRIPALLATFATSIIALGLNFWLGNGISIRLTEEISSPTFMALGSARFLGIPIPFVIAVTVFILLYILLEKSRWGLRMYAVGGNVDAATHFGINIRLMKFVSFVICGFTAAVAGLILAARLGSGSPIGGDSYTLDAIAAVFVGVSMFREGEPHLLGTVLGVLIFGILVNGMRLMGVGYELQSILRGIFILAAVAIAGNRAQYRIKLF